MTRLSRNYMKSSFFHVMVQGINKEDIFYCDKDKIQYLKFITKIKEEINVGRETIRTIINNCK